MTMYASSRAEDNQQLRCANITTLAWLIYPVDTFAPCCPVTNSGNLAAFCAMMTTGSKPDGQPNKSGGVPWHVPLLLKVDD